MSNQFGAFSPLILLFSYCSGCIRSFSINTPWLSLNISQDFGKSLNLPGSNMSAFSLSFSGSSVGLKCLCSRIRCSLQLQYHQFCRCLQCCPANSISPEEMPEKTLKKPSSKISTWFYYLYALSTLKDRTWYVCSEYVLFLLYVAMTLCNFSFLKYVHSCISVGTLLSDWNG